jgi:hypothetical protein
MSKINRVKKLKLVLRSYSIFFTLTLTVAIGALIYEMRTEMFSLYRYSLSMLVIIFVFAISALPFDIRKQKKDKRMCSHFGVSYEDFLLKPENEQDKLRSSFNSKD